MKKQIKKLLLGTFFILGMVSAAHAWINRESAVLSIMNKAAGKVQTLTVPVGVATTFEKLNVIVRSCKQTDPFDAEDFFVFVEISKSGEGQIFGGWMSRNEPGDNPLQNEDYDLWLVECK